MNKEILQALAVKDVRAMGQCKHLIFALFDVATYILLMQNLHAYVTIVFLLLFQYPILLFLIVLLLQLFYQSSGLGVDLCGNLITEFILRILLNFCYTIQIMLFVHCILFQITQRFIFQILLKLSKVTFINFFFWIILGISIAKFLSFSFYLTDFFINLQINLVELSLLKILKIR